MINILWGLGKLIQADSLHADITQSNAKTQEMRPGLERVRELLYYCSIL